MKVRSITQRAVLGRLALIGIVGFTAWSLSACSSTVDPAPETDDFTETEQEATEAAVEDAVTTVEDEADTAETETATTTTTTETEEESTVNTRCHIAALAEPDFGSTSCSSASDGKTITIDFGGCKLGKRNQLTLDGTVTLAFDAAATCDAWIPGITSPTSGTLTRTTSDWSLTFGSGAVLTRTTDDKANYLGVTYGGGTVITYSSTGRSFDIQGVNIVRTAPSGNVRFDHTIHTTSPMVITGTRENGDRHLSSGEMVVDHNKRGFTRTVTYTDLEWDADCCHPVSGSIAAVLSGSVEKSTSAEFKSTCGEVNFTHDDGTTTVRTLPDCR